MQRHPDFDAQPTLRIARGCSILNVATLHLVNIEQIEILTLAPSVYVYFEDELGRRSAA
jgi:hypothetical protein